MSVETGSPNTMVGNITHQSALVLAFPLLVGACDTHFGPVPAEDPVRRTLGTGGPPTLTTRAYANVHVSRAVIPSRPLTNEGAAGRWHFRVHTRGLVVERVERVNPDGVAVESDEIWREPDGVSIVVSADRSGVEQFRTIYEVDGLIRRLHRDRQQQIRGCPVVYDELDPQGRVAVEKCFSAKLPRHALTDNTGCHALHHTYSDYGDRSSTGCFDVEGHATAGKYGFHLRKSDYDAQGQEERVCFFDMRDAPTLDSATNCHCLAYAYDHRGNRERWTCEGFNGQVGGFHRTSAHTRHEAYDHNNCSVGVSWRDPAGERVRVGDHAEIIMTVDKACRATEVRRLGEHGDLLYRTEYVRNADGLPRMKRCFGSYTSIECPTGPGSVSGSGSTIKYAYDSFGRLKLVWNLNGGTLESTLTCVYSNTGRLHHIDLRDGNGRRVDDCWRRVSQYNEVGMLGAELCREGSSKSLAWNDKFQYDRHRRLTTLTTTWEVSEPYNYISTTVATGIIFPGNAARMQVVRNSHGVVTENQFFDTAGALIERRMCGLAQGNCFEDSDFESAYP